MGPGPILGPRNSSLHRILIQASGAHHVLHAVVAKVPALVDGDFKLWEAAAITQTSPTKRVTKLCFPTTRASGRISRWQVWESTHFNEAFGALTFETLVKAKYNLGPPDLARTEAASRIGGRRNSRFTNYSRLTDWHMQPAWLDGREVLAVLKAPGGDTAAVLHRDHDKRQPHRNDPRFPPRPQHCTGCRDVFAR